MKLEDFKRKWENKICDFDGFYGGQCTDLYRMYCKEVLGVPQSPLVKGAKNIWTTYLKEHFKQIPNTPEGVPEKGDIVIWGMGTYGHVGICDHASVSTVTCFEQNWLGGGTRPSEIRRHGYKDVLGWLRYKKPIIPDDTTMTKDETRALNTIKKFKEEENKLKDGNYEGATNSAIGAWQDLANVRKTLKTTMALLKSAELAVKTLNGKLATETENHSAVAKKLSTANKTLTNKIAELENETKLKKQYRKYWDRMKPFDMRDEDVKVRLLFKWLLIKLGLWPKEK